MTSAPSTNCSCSSFTSKLSAGGHVEHPSEVKSSTTTGVRFWGGGEDFARAPHRDVAVEARSKLPKTRTVLVFEFIWVVLFPDILASSRPRNRKASKVFRRPARKGILARLGLY